MAWLPCSTRAGTLVVSNLADSGAGSLRGALASAQNGDVITFSVSGTITNVSGQWVISNSVDVIGPGADTLAVVGSSYDRAFRILSGAKVSLSGLTLRNSHAINGGGLHVDKDGGGIYNEGNLALTNCTFAACRSGLGYDGWDANGISPSAAGDSGGNGGAIYTAGTLIAVNCNFLTNSAAAGGRGGSGYGPGSTGSPGGDGGGGGAVYAAGPATFIGCAFGFNSAGAGGAGGTGGSASSAKPGPGGRGGNSGRGGSGSAVFSPGEVTFRSCTLANNNAGAGGTAGGGGSGYSYYGGLGGSGGAGGSGALYCGSTGQLAACTFTGNAAGRGANGAGGGTGGTGYAGGNGGNGGAGGSGGAIFCDSTNAVISLQNALVAQNTAGSAGSSGGGGASGSGWPGPPAASGTSGVAGSGPDLLGAFTSLGHNLIGLRTGNAGFTNNVLNDLVGTNTTLNARVGALTNNGAFTRTCALLAGSPALDAGDDAVLAAPLNLTSDQRGYPRQSGAHVDIGAYELQSAVLPIVAAMAMTDGAPSLTLANVPGAVFTVLATTDVTRPVSSWSALGAMSEIAPGQFQWVEGSFTNRSQRFLRLRSP